MSKKFLIIITGIPGTGKTTLGGKLSKFLRIPIVSKDNIKEILFDTIGYSDISWSRKLGSASYQLLHFIIDKFLQFERTFIIESNFDSIYLKDMIDLLQKNHTFVPIIVHCYADMDTIYSRIIERDKSPARHIGHNGHNVEFWGSLEEFKTNYAESINKIPDIDEHIIKVDTTNLNESNYTELFERIGIIMDN